MNSDPDPDELDRERDSVRAAFRAAGFDDEPPPELDAAILAAAERAQRRGVHGYLPPLAMAATVVLALGLVLRIALPTRELPSAADVPAAEHAPDAAEALRAPGPESSGRAEVMRERAASQPAERARDAAEPMPATVSVPAAPHGATTAAEQGAARSTFEAARAPATGCGARFGDDPDGWLACIVTLLDADEQAAARREIEIFSMTFPGRVVPEAIVDRLVP